MAALAIRGRAIDVGVRFVTGTSRAGHGRRHL